MKLRARPSSRCGRVRSQARRRRAATVAAAAVDAVDADAGIRDPGADRAARHRDRRRLDLDARDAARCGVATATAGARGDAWPAVIGKTGSAWGDGLHGSGAPAPRRARRRARATARAPPARSRSAARYGYAEDAPKTGAALHARSTTTGSASTIRSRRTTRRSSIASTSPSTGQSPSRCGATTRSTHGWSTSRTTPTRTPRAGSCIFLHVWSGPESTTVGCTAMAEPELAQLIGRSTPRARVRAAAARRLRRARAALGPPPLMATRRPLS